MINLIDAHTHTLASGHAYSTIHEMAFAAANRGLKILGITEHAPMMPGTCHDFYFRNLKVIPRQMCGIELVLGAEVNILNVNGDIDLDDDLAASLDIIIASLHPPCIPFGTKEENTQALINVMKKDYVNILGHPDDSRYPIDIKRVVQAAKENHILIELNNASLKSGGPRVDALENDIRILKYCEMLEVPIIVNSDAHIDIDVADIELQMNLIREMNFPKHLIVNDNLELFRSYLNKYKK